MSHAVICSDLLSLLTTSTMGRRPTTREEVHKKKLLDAATYLKNASWHSTNDFVLDHYNSPASASQSLRLQPKSTTYSPDAIMAAWLANVPSDSALKSGRLVLCHAVIPATKTFLLEF